MESTEVFETGRIIKIYQKNTAAETQLKTNRKVRPWPNYNLKETFASKTNKHHFAHEYCLFRVYQNKDTVRRKHKNLKHTQTEKQAQAPSQLRVAQILPTQLYTAKNKSLKALDIAESPRKYTHVKDGADRRSVIRRGGHY